MRLHIEALNKFSLECTIMLLECWNNRSQKALNELIMLKIVNHSACGTWPGYWVVKRMIYALE